MNRVRVVSVNVGRPALLGMRLGAAVVSAIYKRPAELTSLWLNDEQLEGDGQADTRVHGGAEKALYVYPLEHLHAWGEELAAAELFVPGAIGENLTVTGCDESTVRIGDVWRWGDALVQVCQPRHPCFKLAMRTGHPELLKRFEQTGRCGWYMRVLQPGYVPAAVPLELDVVDRHTDVLSVREAQRLSWKPSDPADVERAAEHPALGDGWRRNLRRRLASVHTPAP